MGRAMGTCHNSLVPEVRVVHPTGTVPPCTTIQGIHRQTNGVLKSIIRILVTLDRDFVGILVAATVYMSLEEFPVAGLFQTCIGPVSM